MGLISGLFSLPLAPLKGTVWVAERVQEEAERQYYDPGAIRRKLEDVADARDAGTISDEEAKQLEKELVARLIEANRRPKEENRP
ncbi:gas vesicle protein GvpG [Citricoccus sp. GCM10030269]|uniref:gas vesicle protein GvpG n=1 Tax=Citricoccus sp. GCM10030269 TaxID=3273388 RepID=UPI0036208921